MASKGLSNVFKLRDIINVKDPAYGAKGDGSTDDASAINAALAAVPQYGAVYFPSGTYIIGTVLTASVDNVLIYGKAKIKAKDTATGMTLMFTASGRTGIVVEDLEFDANKSGRASGQSVTYNGLAFPTSTDCAARKVTVRNCLGYSSTSATSLSASAATRFIADKCKLLDGGTSATTLPSDGIFVRGDNCKIVDCAASSITDTAFVLEGCNFSTIANCSGESCTALAAISNDTGSDCVGNVISGLTGSCNYMGSTGGIVGVACFGAGNLRDCKVSGVSIRLTSGATNLGPAVQIRHTSTGRVIGLTIDNPTIDRGAAIGVMAQGILVSDCDDIQINNPAITNDATSGSACIRFDGASVNGVVNGGVLKSGDYGVQAQDTAEIKIRNVVMKTQNTYGIQAGDTSTVVDNGSTITASGSAAVNRASGATLITSQWQAWTPTYSSDIGNAAATFSGGTVTTTLARFSVRDKMATITIFYAATLNAVTPAYIDVTFPTGIASANTATRNPAMVMNGGVYETGIARTITSVLRVYRANVAAYSSAGAVEGAVTFSFEI